MQNTAVAQLQAQELGVVIMEPVLVKVAAAEQAAQQDHVVLHLDCEQYKRNKLLLQFHSCSISIP